MVAMPPSSTKSPVFRPVLAPLRAWEAAEQARLAPEIKTATTQRGRLERQIKHQEGRLFKLTDPGKRLEAERELDRLQRDLDARPCKGAGHLRS